MMKDKKKTLFKWNGSKIHNISLVMGIKRYGRQETEEGVARTLSCKYAESIWILRGRAERREEESNLKCEAGHG